MSYLLIDFPFKIVIGFTIGGGLQSLAASLRGVRLEPYPLVLTDPGVGLI